MRNEQKFMLPEFGIFQNLTTPEMRELAREEQHLVEAPAILYLKNGWKISNRSLSGKGDMDVWLISSLIYRKN